MWSAYLVMTQILFFEYWVDLADYVLVPADKVANNVVVVWRLFYNNTLKRELIDTTAYKLQPSLSDRVIVDGHGCHTALHFDVKAKENQDKVPTLYWLPKLQKNT